MKPFYNKNLGHAILQSANKNLKPWRQELSATMQALNRPLIPRLTPVCVSLAFYFERPKSVSKKRTAMTVKPDVDKLIRAVFDAMTGTLVEDDSQITHMGRTGKEYGTPERVEIRLEW